MGAKGAEYDIMIPWNVKKQKLNLEHTEQCHGNISYLQVETILVHVHSCHD